MPSVGFTTPPNERSEATDDFFVTIDGELTEGYPITDHSEGSDPLYHPAGAVTTSEQPNPLAQTEATFESVAPDSEPALDVPSSATSAALEEELEEVEFFIQQGLYDEAVNMLTELSQAYPGNPLVLEKLNELSSVGEADDLLDQSFDLGSQIPNELGDDSEFSQPLTSEDGVKDVFEQFKQGVAQQVDAGDANTHYDLGVAYKEMGLVEDAVAEFEIARENPEREAISQTMIGDCFVQAGQLTDAINAYKRGLYAERKTPDEELQLYYALGTTYLALADNAEALYYFQKVAKREPNFRDVQQQINTLQGY
jgi:tetratricopeptide (TPR) repeat protein